MCGRVAVRRPAGNYLRQLGLFEEFSEHPNHSVFFGRANVCPGQEIAVVRLTPDGRRELVGCLWGLIPRWSKDGRAIPGTHNARAETVATKAAFRAPYLTQRCVIPVDGFYEPKGAAGQKRTPYFVHLKDDLPFGLAGLWERWTDDAGHSLDSCTILTTTPNAALAQIHDRMPVILQPGDYDAWLDPKTPDGRLRALLKPYDGDLELFEVTKMGSLDRPAPDPGLFG